MRGLHHTSLHHLDQLVLFTLQPIGVTGVFAEYGKVEFCDQPGLSISQLPMSGD